MVSNKFSTLKVMMLTGAAMTSSGVAKSEITRTKRRAAFDS